MVFDALRELLGFGTPADLHDPVLGTLTRDARGWRAVDLVSAVPVWMRADRHGPTAALRTSAADAACDLATLEARARAYAEAESPYEDPALLRLAGVEVGIAHPEWVQQEVTGPQPDAAAALRRGVPAVSLEFTIDGDDNVLDVVLVEGVPVAWEYH
jgi:hypothetical protein